MERLVRFFVERHLLVHVIVGVVVVSGLVSMNRSATEGFPIISMPRLLIRADLPARS